MHPCTQPFRESAGSGRCSLRRPRRREDFKETHAAMSSCLAPWAPIRLPQRLRPKDWLNQSAASACMPIPSSISMLAGPPCVHNLWSDESDEFGGQLVRADHLRRRDSWFSESSRRRRSIRLLHRWAPFSRDLWSPT